QRHAQTRAISRELPSPHGLRAEDEMNETPLQRILAHVEDEEPLAVQAATCRETRSPDQGCAHGRIAKNEKSSVSEMFAHLADEGIVGAFRLRFIFAFPGSPVVAYDQDKSTRVWELGQGIEVGRLDR